MARVVGVGAMVIIADFDEQGFELLSRVHRTEVREHPGTAATVSLAQDDLSRAGFRCVARTNGHQNYVVMLQKRAEPKELRDP